MGSERPAPSLPANDQAERAARVRAMLTRWRSEDVSTEPEWNVQDIQRVRLDATPLASRDE